MNTALAVLALLVSLVALILALRGRRAPDVAPPPPPPPPPPPEDRAARARLDRIESERKEALGALRTLTERVERIEGSRAVETAELRASLERLRTAVEDLAAAPPESPDPEDEPVVEPATRVREQLRAEGWEKVVLLPDGEDAWRVEARRGGGLAKGRARLFPDGRVEAQLAPPTRAFP